MSGRPCQPGPALLPSRAMRASAFPPVAALICAAAWPASALSGPSGADLRRVGEEVAAAGAAERDPALLIA
ncbi:MAG: hypothetical protein ACP5EN_17375, partial [Rhodovulum sp.]